VHHHIIVRISTRILVPFILLFALYVQFHGDFGPGGGFQAGVIFGAGCILYGLVFGVDALMGVAPMAVVRTIAAGGVLLFASVGVAALLAGGNYLDYSVLGATPVAGQHLGIFLIELGVGMTVAAVVISLYYGFTNR
jgi:multicomponent Na+:H+ antiporter subunit B